MHLSFLILFMVIFPSILSVDRTAKISTKSPHPYHAVAANPNTSLPVDCALRAFTIEMAAYIAPASSKTNWTTLSQSAFQMNQCNGTNYTNYQPPRSAKPFKAAPEMRKGACHQKVFVDDSKGDDLFDGTLEKPMKTIQAALSFTRKLRTVHSNNGALCITIRGGTYYLGTNATTSSSQIGAIALTSNDSNLVIENYENETVILSGGALLHLQWSVHAKTEDGGTIMKAQVPSYVNLDQFNELYIDERRAIVAKFPNGDPSTQGLYASNPGFSFKSESWIPPIHIPTVNILVPQPSRAGTKYPNYTLSLGGGASVFNPPSSFWGSHDVPRGLTVQNGSLPHISNWTKPSTGLVHTFHGHFWGGWIFEIESINSTQNTIIFGRGGFQEARGTEKGGPFYVANIFEELDSPNEWFLDKDTRTLYFMPNDTMPTIFVASQVPCLISVNGGGIENPVNNVLIQGVTLTQTTNTYMREYMVPSGGDWSVHRGGTVYLRDTKNITITKNLFTQLGGIGVVVIDYNDATSITLNEFVWLADSGVILVGNTNGIDGFSVSSQPANTLIQSNIFHETGIYVKQSSPVLISVSRSVSIIGNLMFNMPRAAININDGFYGNHTLSYNVIFNTVRETGDHGPINTWDRQPYLTDAVQPGIPSVWQHTSYIHHNTLFNNYRTVWPIDHDDGSCFYEDSFNFQVYGGKKNFLGHSKTDHDEIYVYPDAKNLNCLYDFAAKRGVSGWNETWVSNTCILYQNPEPYFIKPCDTADLFVPYMANNKFYVPSDTELVFTCNVSGAIAQLDFKQWQSYGLDLGSTVQTAPDVHIIIEWGRKMLQGII